MMSTPNPRVDTGSAMTQAEPETILAEARVEPLTEARFLASALSWAPRLGEGADKFKFPSVPSKKDENFEILNADFEVKKAEYQNAINDEFCKFSNTNEPSAVYLVFQPMWNAKTSHLSGLEVLCRIANGKDDAPMPGLSVFQETQKANAIQFLKKQTEFAVDACKKLPHLRISVNVRPDELFGVKDFLIEKATETSFNKRPSNLLIEITEYAPIDDATLALIQEMNKQGVIFAIDDVTEVRENPGKCMAKTGQHSCSFALAKANAGLFAVQKLSLPMSCSVFRTKVYPTPEYAGGQPNLFLQGLIFPEDQTAEIEERKLLVEDWVAEVTKQNPSVQFVIECSVYPEDALDSKNNSLYPNIPLFDGKFDIQGGRSGGRGFPIEAFLRPLENKADKVDTEDLQ